MQSEYTIGWYWMYYWRCFSYQDCACLSRSRSDAMVIYRIYFRYVDLIGYAVQGKFPVGVAKYITWP